ncbi:hypothetical protein Dd1591_2103 [Dickeya chrysanthemi Ech1591]|uniref:Uncharacterized protein n=1 Tax=Dickeya chrysanthemi (strain Ech1591) TaxID=561229 RepID=C6CIA0_DICC1|nr:hypothetical protein Dd1591_2103 [Dickeya chrysanthemi Ech1591]
MYSVMIPAFYFTLTFLLVLTKSELGLYAADVGLNPISALEYSGRSDVECVD